nr:PREDICTED: NEDD4 family-interacting protein 2 [Bos mutus]
MGRRRTQRACATIPSMLSSARGAPELRPQAAADAEVSAASAAATESGYVPHIDFEWVEAIFQSRGQKSALLKILLDSKESSQYGEMDKLCRLSHAVKMCKDSQTPSWLPEPRVQVLGTGEQDSSCLMAHTLLEERQLHNEEDNSESSAVEQPSTSNPTPHTVQAAPSASGHETESSPPPYSSITVEVPTTSDTEVYSEFYPVPPPYSVATSLPTYDEAEKAKAAALAAAAAETSQRIQEEECPPRDDFNDPDQLRVGNDGIFMLAFFMAFIFNWLGFCLSFCITNTIAGRYGAICGFGLSLIKWILIVRFSDYFTGYFNGQYWLWWIFLVLGLLLFFRGFVNYLKVRNMSESMAAAHRTRYFFLL